jgi:acyl-CoA reductase-like NAD-dependent aldehyde dehydrogenase
MTERTLTARNPLTGAIDYAFAAPSAAALLERTMRLRAAAPGWRALGAEGRARILRDWRAELVGRRAAILAALVADTGRRRLAEQEFDAVLALIERSAAEAPALLAAAERPSAYFPEVMIRARGVPYELVGAISPWNFPLLLAMIDAVPALLAGSAAFVKPSEATPRFVDPLRGAIAAVPELARVLDVAAGDGETGAGLVPLVDVVAFTGSVATGRKVGEAAAKAFIPAFLELGGKDPAIVLDGADLERAATAILRASVVGTGQACQSLERVYVARTVFAAFVRLIVEKAKATRLAFEPHGVIGPLIFARQADIIAEHLKDAREKGAIVHCGGEIIERGGKWIAPTVMTNVRHDMKIIAEETFGPIIPVMPFATEDEAVALANDSLYGLSAAVFGPDEAAAIGLAERLEAGGVSINDAGLTTMIFEAEKSGFKLSGLGPSRMGPTGLTRFLRRQALYLNRGDVVPIAAFAEKS